MCHTRSTLDRILANAAISLIGLTLVLTLAATAQAQTTVTGVTEGGLCGTVNLTNGQWTQLTSGNTALAGIGELGANLYGGQNGSNSLYRVSPTTCTYTLIGNGSSGVAYRDFGATTAGTLYGINGNSTSDLYSVNPSNGATTFIGSTNLATGGAQSVSADCPVLYATGVPGSDAVLYLVNTTTAAITEIGNTGVGGIGAMVCANGFLYAATEAGDLYTLSTTNGQATLIGPTEAELYGMAYPASTFSVLHTFTGAADGGNPFAAMIIDSSGNLFGTAGTGGTGSCSYFGTTGCGTIFELKKHNSSFIFNPLYSFQGGTDGEFSVRPMTPYNGTYYGATLGGGEGTCSYDGVPECGVVFNVGSSPTPQRTPLLKFIEHGIPYRFTGGSDGATPFTTLIFDSSGNIYGTTYAGGSHGFGTVFELVSLGGGNYMEKVLWSFAGGNDGAYPVDGLIADSAGNFYGTTTAGGSTTACSGGGCGTVFKLAPTGGGNYTEAPIYSFHGTSDGENPNAGVAMDAAGNLYGNTWQGGTGGGGTVYELTPNGGNWTFNLLYSVPNAGFAVGRVILDSSGNLYEALQKGGAFGDGQVLELMHSGSNWNYIDLYDFTGGSDGAYGIGGVVFDSSGNLYGTTETGAGTGCGGGGCGTVWELMPNN